jgi:hypothetical protein
MNKSRIAILTLFLLSAHIVGSQAQTSGMNAEVLPLNKMVTVTAPSAPLDRQSAPKKLARYFWSSYAPYVKVYRFIVEPGSKYTLYFRHPADGIYRNAMIKTETPLTDDMANYTRKGSSGFVVYGQQPWKNPRGQLFRHSFTISPKSDNKNLYMILQCGKPGVSFDVMLKSPPDSDEDVKKSTGNNLGTVWSTPLTLSTVPGTAGGSSPAPSPSPGGAVIPTSTPSPVATGGPTLTAASLGGTWNVNEAGRWFGTWIRRPGTNIFDATWKNSSGQTVRDTVTIESVKGNAIVMIRQGNGGRYTGTLSADGSRITGGTASWYKKGENWSATISR